jgi:hypothetical protein
MGLRRFRALSVLLFLSACAAPGDGQAPGVTRADPLVCPVGLSPGVATTLFLGRGQDAAAVITDAQLRRFLDEAVTPRFPGFTLLDATGSWKGRTESSALLLIGHCSEPESLAALDAVAAEYARRFRQEAVGRTDTATCQNFCARGTGPSS